MSKPTTTHPHMKPFDVTIVEVIMHRTTLEAPNVVAARLLCRDLWNEHGPEAFTPDTLGRTELIRADEVRS